jgi:hypothetical protein
LRRVHPAVALLLVAPVLGELVSGHQAPLEFLNPLNFVVLSLPYGLGALVSRELIVRWGKGRFSLLLLGMAFGVYEEGIVVRSFFNPDWAELGALARYGRFAGVNWTWSELLIHFHMLISIGASVMLAEILYPARRRQSWVSNRVLIACLIGLLAWVPVGWLMTAYRPPAVWYALSWIAVLALVWVAYRLPARPLLPRGRAAARPFVFLLLGLVNMSVFFFTVFLTAESGEPPLAVTVLFLILLDTATLWLALRWSDNGYAWDDRHRLALVAGLLGFFVYFCVDHDLEQWKGSSLVALAAIVALWQLGRSTARRIHSPESAGGLPARGDVG